MAIKLSYVKTEPVEIATAGIWTVKFTVTARDQRNQPVSNQQIRFLHGVATVGTETTNEDGKCEFTYNFPIAGGGPVFSETVSIQPDPVSLGTPISIVLTYKKSVPPTRRVDKLEAYIRGGNGKYTALVTVKDQNALPMPDVDIHVFEQAGSHGRFEEVSGSPTRTDKDGFTCLYLPSFRENRRRYFVTAGGATEEARVSGPSSSPPPPKMKVDDKDRIETMAAAEPNMFRRIWLSFSEGWRRGRTDKIKQERG